MKACLLHYTYICQLLLSFNCKIGYCEVEIKTLKHYLCSDICNKKDNIKQERRWVDISFIVHMALYKLCVKAALPLTSESKSKILRHIQSRAFTTRD